MLTTKQYNKLESIYNNWLNGNRKEAAKSVRNLTRIEVFVLCVGDFYSDCPENKRIFENFVGRVLSDRTFYS